MKKDNSQKTEKNALAPEKSITETAGNAYGGANGAAIILEELSKVYRLSRHRSIIALDSLSLEIREGEIFGLLGPNGSGKTTALKLILGLLFPTRGRVTVFGRDVSLMEVKASIGYLPEHPYYYRYLSGRELIEFYGGIFGLPKEMLDERCAELLKLVGLEKAGELPLKNYSKGMLERVGLASALVNDPTFLILDEPTTGLDPIGSRDTRDLLLRLRGEGKTILLSSHYLSEVERVSDRVGILHQGKLMDVGNIRELMTKWQAEDIENLFIKVIECSNQS